MKGGGLLVQSRGCKSLSCAIGLFVAVGLIGNVASGSAATSKTYGYVATTLTLPTTNAELLADARDIDRDGQRDNLLGELFVALAQKGVDLRTELNAAIERGDLLMLHSLRTSSFKRTSDATWQVLYGEQTANPDFSGFGSFTVDDAAPRSARLPATIKNKRVKTAAGSIPLRLAMFERIFDLELRKAKILATCSKSDCSSGRISGVITAEHLDTHLIPELAEQLTAIVQRDCTMPGDPGGGCMSGSPGKTIFDLFDGNDNLVISDEELRQNSLVPLIPDLDLAKANGKPGRDGEADAMSVGLGFEAVSAQLNGP